ncbi:hypothetical protein BRADI_1g11066v3 [Brachypodium distachyon]|uniref:RNase H type-1 domain-containing protein n=1 Tax=Brachypodium distachyon TaxID=15368 RepID=A0A2K2DIY5_BRADI|nr:hypothetical protein BRADI_1g11066v3 [Brachypodium distachyon]
MARCVWALSDEQLDEHVSGFLKFNVDGGVAKTQNKGASAVVCRDLQDPPTLEALACCEALALPKDLNADKLYIASDAAEVVKGIISGTQG